MSATQGIAAAVAPPAPARRRADTTVLWQAGVGIALLGAWELCGRLIGTTWTSAPSLIAARLLHWAQGDLAVHVLTTVEEVLAGLFAGSVCGILAGLALGRSPIVAGIVRPIVVAFYSVPLVALAPLFIMFFGLDVLPKVVLVAIVVFFLLFFNTFSGAAAVDRDLIATLELMGATRTEIFRKVVAPACMVWIISGVKLALPYALVAATTGEMLAARRGIGWLLSDAAAQFDMTSLYAALFLLMLLGLAVSEAAARCERVLLRWRHAEG
jgi:NitT/TauT family transport system permease protein